MRSIARASPLMAARERCLRARFIVPEVVGVTSVSCPAEPVDAYQS